jgi:hypothetical protein
MILNNVPDYTKVKVIDPDTGKVWFIKAILPTMIFVTPTSGTEKSQFIHVPREEVLNWKVEP